ncbi:hypothetical protein MTO96_039103, partial [Rhipicephalus appendiculatus]
SHHQEYGPNLNNFGRDNAIGACVWVSTIVLSLLVTWDMAKTVYADVLACWRLCGRYRGEAPWRTGLERRPYARRPRERSAKRRSKRRRHLAVPVFL